MHGASSKRTAAAMISRLDPNAKKASAKDLVDTALKSRKKGKGQKLGGKK